MKTKKKGVIRKLFFLSQHLPEKYYNPLNPKEKIKQLKELEKSRELYRKGKYYSRKKMSSFKGKVSRHVTDFKKCYGIPVTSDLKKIEKVTGVPVEVSKKILNKGRGAYYSSGSRPNQTAESWARARLASAILKRGAFRVDKHIFIDEGKDPKIIKKCKKKK